jgi:hypothetical protein
MGSMIEVRMLHPRSSTLYRVWRYLLLGSSTGDNSFTRYVLCNWNSHGRQIECHRSEVHGTSTHECWLVLVFVNVPSLWQAWAPKRHKGACRSSHEVVDWLLSKISNHFLCLSAQHRAHAGESRSAACCWYAGVVCFGSVTEIEPCLRHEYASRLA